MKLKKKKIKLKGFNNLTKSLSFNIYDICYAKSESARKEYLKYLDEVYNSERLEKILKDVSEIIEANILHIATQDYDPLGASVTVLIAEEQICETPKPETTLMHLDKSHLCAHTYPETDFKSGISTFRVDIDIATCGHISPLKALNYLIGSFDSEVVLMDYRVRGFTRDIEGKKHFIDHKIYSIQNFISKTILKNYQAVDFNIYQENLFHTKMLLKDFKLKNYLFGTTMKELNKDEKRLVKERLTKEMTEIFYAKNIYR